MPDMSFIKKNALPAPAYCATCAGIRDCVDLGIDYGENDIGDRFGAILLCVNCVKRAAGLLPVEKEETIPEPSVEEIKIAADELVERIENDLSSLGDLISDLRGTSSSNSSSSEDSLLAGTGLGGIGIDGKDGLHKTSKQGNGTNSVKKSARISSSASDGLGLKGLGD